MVHASPGTPVDPHAQPPAEQRRLLPLVILMFFAWGFCTVLVDTLIPKLKAVFSLNYAEVMLTQFCFFMAYFVVSVPASWVLGRLGYLRSLSLGLLIMAVACLLFTPAARLGWYPAFLAALFILASGITLLQVAANPLTAALGSAARAHSRLNLAQAFNSVGTMIGPWFGAALILSGGLETPDIATLSPQALSEFRAQEAAIFRPPFMIIAGVLLAFAAVCWWLRRAPTPALARAEGGAYGRVLRQPRLALGAVSIFLYVGAEVSIGSTLVNFLIMDHTLHTSAERAGQLVSVYWGLAMVGRFIGSVVLRHVHAGTVLAFCAVGASVLSFSSTVSAGLLAAVVVLSIGLFNSIMFPTIFSLSLEGLGKDSASGSGALCLSIVGGAIVPLITGFVADLSSLPVAYLVPAICYVWIAFYAVLIRRGRLDHADRSPAALAKESG